MPELSKPMMPSLAGNPIAFLQEVRRELFKVVWPQRAEVVKMTIIVIAVSVAIGLYIGGLDLGLTKVTDLLVKR